jgi:hypothetical protein
MYVHVHVLKYVYVIVVMHVSSNVDVLIKLGQFSHKIATQIPEFINPWLLEIYQHNVLATHACIHVLYVRPCYMHVHVHVWGYN